MTEELNVQNETKRSDIDQSQANDYCRVDFSFRKVSGVRNKTAHQAPAEKGND